MSSDTIAEDVIVLPATQTPPVRPPAARMTIVMVLVLATLLGALMVVGYSVVALTHDRDGWRKVATQVQLQNEALEQQVADQSTVQACRSQANFKTVSSTARVIQLISQLILAAQDAEQSAAIRLLLPPASQALDDAIAAQDAAIPDSPGGTSTCNPTPP